MVSMNISLTLFNVEARRIENAQVGVNWKLYKHDISSGTHGIVIQLIYNLEAMWCTLFDPVALRMARTAYYLCTV
jgi:hypothetical protein